MHTTNVTCTCGQVGIAFRGTPIMSAACYCDDCQAGGHAIEALPGAAPVLGPDGGTDYLMYRNDRYEIVRGADLLQPHKLTDKTISKRMVAACCNTAMYLGFDAGPHWISAYRLRFPEGAPPVELRTNTKFAPDPEKIPPGAKIYSTWPLSFIARLMAARAAMLFGR